MSYLTREDILTADDRPVEDVQVPAWGGTVRVRGLSAAKRDQIEGEIAGAGGKGPTFENVRAKAVAEAIVDEGGYRVFSDADVKRLGGKSGAALDEVFQVVRRLSGMENEATEEAEGNSEPGH